MTLNNIKQLRKDRGFTIVELLIVIIVIAILAAIVIVAYQGITAKANASKNQTNAVAVQKKAEAFAADNSTNGGNGAYPSGATSAATQPFPASSTGAIGVLPTGITTQAAAPTATTNTSTVQYVACAAVADGTPATGYYIGYWDPSASPAGVKYVFGGSVTTGGSCPTGTSASSK